MTTDAPTRDLTLEARVLATDAKIRAIFARTEDRRWQNDLLDIWLALTGGRT